MNIKIFTHLMPWELDDASQTFNRIALAKRYLNPEDNICIETCLNLSSYMINWEKSQIPKQFFIDKYKYISNHLYEYNHKTNIYDDNKLYGHLDFQRELIESNVDYYISICSDIYFHQHSLCYLIESAKRINDPYFLITLEIPKLWDSTWDICTNKNFQNDSYHNWDNRNINEIIHISENIEEDAYLEKLNMIKFAGWFDLFNKNFYEKLVPCQEDWHGYGPWDSFSTNVCTIAKRNFNLNINQYILRNRVVFDKDIGIFQNKKNPSVYKKYLSLNDIPNQRIEFESKMERYMQVWYENSKRNNII